MTTHQIIEMDRYTYNDGTHVMRARRIALLSDGWWRRYGPAQPRLYSWALPAVPTSGDPREP